jgi:hypothetical protein
MSLYNTIWNRVRSTSDKAEKESLKFLLGEVQRVEPKDPSDETVTKVIKKTIKNLEQTLTQTFDSIAAESIAKELVWFNSYLPKPLPLESYGSFLAMYLATEPQTSIKGWREYLVSRVAGVTLDMAYAIKLFQDKKGL